MVKNLIGGCKSKRNARKFAIEENTRSSRVSVNEYEIFSVVTKLYGNGRCLVKTSFNTELQCVIRNKFKGKFKRNNIIVVGTYLLVGLREWEKMSGYKTCDVLEVYSSQDLPMLSNMREFQQLLTFTKTESYKDDIFDNSSEPEPESNSVVVVNNQTDEAEDVSEKRDCFDINDI